MGIHISLVKMTPDIRRGDFSDVAWIGHPHWESARYTRHETEIADLIEKWARDGRWEELLVGGDDDRDKSPFYRPFEGVAHEQLREVEAMLTVGSSDTSLHILAKLRLYWLLSLLGLDEHPGGMREYWVHF